MKNQKISIIVPVYNSEEYLTECIESLLRQTYKNIEVILVDDGSVDGSDVICDAYQEKDERIKVIHQRNQGVSAARNAGIHMSTGEFLSFVDADDYVDEKYCENMYRAIDDETGIVIARTIAFRENMIDDGYQGGSEDSFVTKDEKMELYKAVLIDNKSLIKYPHISTCSAKLIRKSIVEIHHIRYHQQMKVYEDAMFNMQVIRASQKVKVIDSKIYFYRYYGNSASKAFNYDRVHQYELVYEQLNNFLGEDTALLKEELDYFKIKNMNTLLQNYSREKSTFRGFYELIQKMYKDDTYKSAVQQVKISLLPKRRKILVLGLRLRLYLLVYMLYVIVKN